MKMMIYWINKKKRHVGIISWTTIDEESLESDQTLLQRQKCQLHLNAEILETRYNLGTVRAIVVNLRDDGFEVYQAGDPRNCEFCSQMDLECN